MIRLLVVFLMVGGLLYLFYDNFDNPTVRVLQAVIEKEVPLSNMVVGVDQLGVSTNVMGKLTRQGAAGTSVVKMEDPEFNNSRLTELASNYKREAMALKMQVEMFANYAKVTMVRLEPNKPAARKVVRVNYDPQADKWNVAE